MQLLDFWCNFFRWKPRVTSTCTAQHIERRLLHVSPPVRQHFWVHCFPFPFRWDMDIRFFGGKPKWVEKSPRQRRVLQSWNFQTIDLLSKTHIALIVEAQIHLLQLNLTPWWLVRLVTQHQGFPIWKKRCALLVKNWGNHFGKTFWGRNSKKTCSC